MSLLLYLCFISDLRALGSPEFATREVAETRLSRYADLCFRFLPVSSSDLEVRRRARRIRSRVLPQVRPPLALLAGSPLAEWSLPGASILAIGRRPGPEWHLIYLRPDGKAPWPARVVLYYYGERSRTQALWRDWHSDQDGREATRLLVDDLLRVGVPPCLLRRMVDHLRAKEQALHSIP